LSGRDFTDFDRENTTPVVVINEAMAKMVWPGQEAIGKRFSIVKSQGCSRLSALVEPRSWSDREEPQPIGVRPHAAAILSRCRARRATTGNPESLLGAVRTQVQQIDKNLAFTNGQTVQQILGQGLWAARMGAALLACSERSR